MAVEPFGPRSRRPVAVLPQRRRSGVPIAQPGLPLGMHRQLNQQSGQPAFPVPQGYGGFDPSQFASLPPALQKQMHQANALGALSRQLQSQTPEDIAAGAGQYDASPQGAANNLFWQQRQQAQQQLHDRNVGVYNQMAGQGQAGMERTTHLAQQGLTPGVALAADQARQNAGTQGYGMGGGQDAWMRGRMALGQAQLPAPGPMTAMTPEFRQRAAALRQKFGNAPGLQSDERANLASNFGRMVPERYENAVGRMGNAEGAPVVYMPQSERSRVAAQQRGAKRLGVTLTGDVENDAARLSMANRGRLADENRDRVAALPSMEQRRANRLAYRQGRPMSLKPTGQASAGPKTPMSMGTLPERVTAADLAMTSEGAKAYGLNADSGISDFAAAIHTPNLGEADMAELRRLMDAQAARDQGLAVSRDLYLNALDGQLSPEASEQANAIRRLYGKPPIKPAPRPPDPPSSGTVPYFMYPG